MATARNPITNDLIKSKTSSDSFDHNYDQIDWSVKLKPATESQVLNLLDDVIADHGELLKDLKD